MKDQKGRGQRKWILAAVANTLLRGKSAFSSHAVVEDTVGGLPEMKIKFWNQSVFIIATS